MDDRKRKHCSKIIYFIRYRHLHIYYAYACTRANKSLATRSRCLLDGQHSDSSAQA